MPVFFFFFFFFCFSGGGKGVGGGRVKKDLIQALTSSSNLFEGRPKHVIMLENESVAAREE